MTPALQAAADKDSADYRRLGTNVLWPHIQEDIDHFFGPLIIMSWETLICDPYLRQCYVQDFGNHDDEKKYVQLFHELIRSNISFYSEIKQWLDKKKPYVAGQLGLYSDFKPFDWKDTYYPRTLCGNKGAGKTTLLLFAKQDIEAQPDRRCLYVCLADPSPASSDSWSVIRSKLIEQLDHLTLRYCEERNFPLGDMLVRRHARFWRLNNAYPHPDDAQNESERKQRVRDNLLVELYKQRHQEEFVKYLSDTIAFLHDTFSVRVAIMIDDVDRLQSDKAAKEVCDRARGLAKELNTVPVVVSIREETMAKLADVSGFATRIPIIPPSFRKVLTKRVEAFSKEYKMAPDKSLNSSYDTDTAKSIVTHIVNSMMHRETYINLIAYHYDIDILLDVVRCVIRSPFISPEYTLELIRRKKVIPWHVILDTMQRFQYRNFYDENSFLLNLYDNDEEPPTLSNALTRVRLLQVIRHQFQGIKKPIAVGSIYTDMEELGYKKRAVEMALSAFARQRLVVTWQMRNAFSEEVRDVLPQPTIGYYLDNLMYSYRYLQNVLPVTHVDFTVPQDMVETDVAISGEKLRVVSGRLYRFASFIEKCEDDERQRARNVTLLQEVTRGEKLVDSLKFRLRQEIGAMKASKEKEG